MKGGENKSKGKGSGGFVNTAFGTSHKDDENENSNNGSILDSAIYPQSEISMDRNQGHIRASSLSSIFRRNKDRITTELSDNKGKIPQSQSTGNEENKKVHKRNISVRSPFRLVRSLVGSIVNPARSILTGTNSVMSENEIVSSGNKSNMFNIIGQETTDLYNMRDKINVYEPESRGLSTEAPTIIEHIDRQMLEMDKALSEGEDNRHPEAHPAAVGKSIDFNKRRSSLSQHDDVTRLENTSSYVQTGSSDNKDYEIEYIFEADNTQQSRGSEGFGGPNDQKTTSNEHVTSNGGNKMPNKALLELALSIGNNPMTEAHEQAFDEFIRKGGMFQKVVVLNEDGVPSISDGLPVIASSSKTLASYIQGGDYPKDHTTETGQSDGRRLLIETLSGIQQCVSVATLDSYRQNCHSIVELVDVLQNQKDTEHTASLRRQENLTNVHTAMFQAQDNNVNNLLLFVEENLEEIKRINDESLFRNAFVKCAQEINTSMRTLVADNEKANEENNRTIRVLDANLSNMTVIPEMVKKVGEDETIFSFLPHTSYVNRVKIPDKFELSNGPLRRARKEGKSPLRY